MKQEPWPARAENPRPSGRGEVNDQQPEAPAVTAEALRAYMAATGWLEAPGEAGPAGKIWSKASFSIGVPHGEYPDVLRSALDRLAWAEGRPVAAVARTVVALYGVPGSPAEPPRAESPAPVPARPAPSILEPAEGVSPHAHVPGPKYKSGPSVFRDCRGCGQRWPCDESWRHRANAAEAKLLEYENAITWGTSCLSCSRLLVCSRADFERAEAAQAKLAAIGAAIKAACCYDCANELERLIGTEGDGRG